MWIALNALCHVWLTKWSFGIKYTPLAKVLALPAPNAGTGELAEVAELADALRSGRSGLTLVRVQIPPSAHEDPLKGGFFASCLRIFPKRKIDV
jgi:hypothetical protein